jgi:hypothetical protein
MTAQKTPAKPVAHLYVGGIYGDEFQDWDLVAERGLCDLLNEQHFANGKEARIPLYASPQPAAQQPDVPDYLVSISWHVARGDDAKAQAEIGELLRALAAAPQAPSREPLSDEQIEPMFRSRKAQPAKGERDAWYWYAWGVEDGERAHGITKEGGKA